MQSDVYGELVSTHRSRRSALNPFSRSPDKQAVVPPDPELAAICRAHVSFLRPGREGRKVFKTLDHTWLQQSVCISVYASDSSRSLLNKVAESRVAFGCN